MLPTKIRNMRPETRAQLQADLQTWSGLLDSITHEGLVVAMRAREGDSPGLVSRVLRVRSWYRAFGFQSPVPSEGHTPPDLRENAQAPDDPTEEEAVQDLGDQAPEGAGEIPREPRASITQVDEDHLHVNVKGQALIMNLEELIHVSGLDTRTWRVARHEVNTWTTSMKAKRVEDGETITEPIVVRNWQVKAWCERRQDRSFRLPALSVVTATTPPAPRNDGRLVALLIPDPQIGFRRIQGRLHPLHDRRALDLAVQMAAILQPDVIVWLGDNMDLAELSEKWPCPASMIDTAEPALAETRYWMARFSATAPGAHQWMIEGNHGDRLLRLRTAHLRGLADAVAPGDSRPALDLGRLLGVDQMSVRYIAPYTTSAWLWDRVEVTHGEVVRPKSGATVAAVSEGLQYSRVFGHIHRAELAHRTVWGPDGPRVIFAATPGCLCRIVDGVVPGVKGRNNWQQALAVVSLDLETNRESVVMPLIDRGRMWWGGSALVGEDPTADVETQIGWPMAADWLQEGE